MVDPAVAHGAFAVGAIPQSNGTICPRRCSSPSRARAPRTTAAASPSMVAPDATATFSSAARRWAPRSRRRWSRARRRCCFSRRPSLDANQIRAALVNAARDVGPARPGRPYGYGELVAEALDPAGGLRRRRRASTRPTAARSRPIRVRPTRTATASATLHLRRRRRRPAPSRSPTKPHCALPGQPECGSLARPEPVQRLRRRRRRSRSTAGSTTGRSCAGRGPAGAPGNQQVCRPALPP